MNKNSLLRLLTILGLLLALSTIALTSVLDLPLAYAQPLVFTDPAGDRLTGIYHPNRKRVGVILLEGFGSDQVTMTSMVSEFVCSNWQVFTFDFSGHGRSPDTLTLNNARTDPLAVLLCGLILPQSVMF